MAVCGLLVTTACKKEVSTETETEINSDGTMTTETVTDVDYDMDLNESERKYNEAEANLKIAVEKKDAQAEKAAREASAEAKESWEKTKSAMKEAGQAMDMKFVYGYIPVDGTLEALIEKKAKKLATEIVMRTSATMKLENQENSPQRIKNAIEERTKELIDEMPKILWD